MVALGNQHGDAGALRIIILLGHVQDVRADDAGNFGQDRGQALGVVDLVDVLDVLAVFRLRARETDVVDVERQRLRQVVEPVKLQLRIAGLLYLRHWHHSIR
jgi:hypothetical protein